MKNIFIEKTKKYSVPLTRKKLNISKRRMHYGKMYIYITINSKSMGIKKASLSSTDKSGTNI